MTKRRKMVTIRENMQKFDYDNGIQKRISEHTARNGRV